jgi:tetratricopeptide (TPR) repeat protein
VGWKEIPYDGPAAHIVKEINSMIWGNETWEKLYSLCSKALELDPDCYTAYIVLGTYAMDKGDLDLMMEMYLEALDHTDTPYNHMDTTDGVWLTLDHLNDHERFAQYTEKMYSVQPHFDVLKALVFRYHKFLGDSDRALELIDEHARSFPENGVRVAKLTLKILKNPMKAESILMNYLVRFPDDKKAKRLLKKARKAASRKV